MLPAFYVTLKKRRRLHAIDRQLVEGLSHIANSIRAGFAMLQAIDAAAQRLQPPLSEEFSRLVADVRLGASLEDALTAMGNRVGSYDLDMVITAILIQRSTGGNLSEVLDNVAETIRERDRIRGEIRVLTAQQRFAAWVLSLWPVVLAGSLLPAEPGPHVEPVDGAGGNSHAGQLPSCCRCSASLRYVASSRSRYR